MFRGVVGVHVVDIHVQRVYIGVNEVRKVYKGCIKGGMI